ncbi:MAG: hypothetical protein K0U98_04220 [Deltaproteobacteria bacterium]|nr:hypothetical protein [Deltaproteobacteria bacterium]
MTKLILQWEQDIAALRQEIEVLKGLLPSVPDTSQVEQWLKEEMQALERSCLAEIVNVSPAEETLFDCIRHSPIESGDHNRYDLHGLLIEGWGPVQPEVFKGPFGKERTGIHRVVRDIGTNVATFRVGSRAQPMNRVAYLQFVFLLQNNINVYGFFYDFITGVQYGKRSETFQYSHVTNYSIREVEADEDRLIRQVDLPPALARSVFGREVSAFFLAVSSGSHFQCVLTDDTLVNGINEWLKVDSEFRKKQQELIDRSELKDEYQKGFTMAESEMGNLGEKARRALGKHVGSDDTLVEEWAREERRDLEEALLEVDARRRFLEDRRIHVARRVLQQIRQEIEDFVAGAAGRRQEGAL